MDTPKQQISRKAILDPWIIEEIERREEEKRKQKRAQKELPIMDPAQEPPVDGPNNGNEYKDKKNRRGVTIIDFSLKK